MTVSEMIDQHRWFVGQWTGRRFHGDDIGSRKYDGPCRLIKDKESGETMINILDSDLLIQSKHMDGKFYDLQVLPKRQKWQSFNVGNWRDEWDKRTLADVRMVKQELEQQVSQVLTEWVHLTHIDIESITVDMVTTPDLQHYPDQSVTVMATVKLGFPVKV